MALSSCLKLGQHGGRSWHCCYYEPLATAHGATSSAGSFPASAAIGGLFPFLAGRETVGAFTPGFISSASFLGCCCLEYSQQFYKSIDSYLPLFSPYWTCILVSSEAVGTFSSQNDLGKFLRQCQFCDQCTISWIYFPLSSHTFCLETLNSGGI